MLNNFTRLVLSFLTLAPLPAVAHAHETSVGYSAEDLELLNEWQAHLRESNDTRFSWDLSMRSVHAAGVQRTGLLAAVGADIHHVFSSPSGDIGTLRLQGYALHADGLPMTPGFFDDPHDWEWSYRIFDFNYTRYASSGMNFRVGHFEVPFGLEQTHSTNGTLQQYLSAVNLGVKADWGVSMNGQLTDYEYEVSLSRGSGRLYQDLDENYLVAGRVGVPREEPLAFGASFLSARLPADGFAQRQRLGVDAVWTSPTFSALGEVSVGSNGDADVVNGMLELNCTSPDDRHLAYAQLIGTDTDGDDKYWANLGTIHYSTDNFSLSSQWKVDLDALEGAERSEAFMLQLRYRF